MIIIISGVQGVGKTTIIENLLKKIKEYSLSISYTTREKRINENNKEYNFISIEEFLQKKKENFFLETIYFNNNYYGTPKEELKNKKIFNITASSINNFLSFLNGFNYKTIFINSSIENIKERLLKRGDKDINNKLLKIQEEIIFKNKFQYVLENNNLENTIEEILKIISF